ncbi:hypothetical protein NG800_005905 [Epilithonimonas ginsengisoli]|uniref:Uncharacterized protein n=1 Tax=Epilithonimonas ginsengisoli TaxID=1245592 RepID=A0ABU4JFU4_9FLAO|nr:MULTISPECIES: hypothetical protein [Chryseobacterium group]MBV6879793.1 hypothetical protein [Epilithonimonas sp. FP105]MDW8548433.1 hypothetical protein [Epilithonimonas ginsengisoli]
MGPTKRLILTLLLISCTLQTKAQQYSPKQIDSILIGTFQLADRNKALKIGLDMYKISENADYYLGMAKAMKVIINSYLGLGVNSRKLWRQLINFWTLRKEKMTTTILYRL